MHIPVVFLTAIRRETAPHPALECGAEHSRKPIDERTYRSDSRHGKNQDGVIENEVRKAFGATGGRADLQLKLPRTTWKN